MCLVVEPQQLRLLELDFYDLAFIKRELTEAAERFLGEPYTQHNPIVPDGRDAFLTFVDRLFAQAPEASLHLKRAVAEDDLVVLHFHLKMFPDDLGQAVIDIFRVQDGRIVEHWDVMQPVPAEPLNDNGMF